VAFLAFCVLNRVYMSLLHCERAIDGRRAEQPRVAYRTREFLRSIISRATYKLRRGHKQRWAQVGLRRRQVLPRALWFEHERAKVQHFIHEPCSIELRAAKLRFVSVRCLSGAGGQERGFRERAHPGAGAGLRGSPRCTEPGGSQPNHGIDPHEHCQQPLPCESRYKREAREGVG